MVYLFNILILRSDLMANFVYVLFSNFSPSSHSNILDRCYHVYLDVGSNIGVQVRKLYQPKYYPRAGVLKVFQEAFGE